MLFCTICRTYVSDTGTCPYHPRAAMSELLNDNITQSRPYSLRRVYLNAGGYEYGKYGSYFGQGAPLYRAECELDGRTYEVRAGDRAGAKLAVQKLDPIATFKR